MTYQKDGKEHHAVHHFHEFLLNNNRRDEYLRKFRKYKKIAPPKNEKKLRVLYGNRVSSLVFNDDKFTNR